MIVQHRIAEPQKAEPQKIEDSREAVLAKIFEDGTKAGLTIAIKHLEQIRDQMSVAEVLKEAQDED